MQPVLPARRLATFMVGIAAALAALGAGQSAADASAAWRFSAPQLVDGAGLTAVSCSTAELCVGVDRTGDVVSSTSPATRSPWQIANVDGLTVLGSISCPSDSFCVAGDNRGNLLVSSDPSAPARTWQATDPHGFYPDRSALHPAAREGLPPGVRGVSCASPSLCVALENSSFGGSIAAGIATSGNPAGGSAGWTEFTGFGSGLTFEAASCPSVTFCALVDQSGSVATSTHPLRGSWTVARADRLNAMTAISCPDVSLCVAVDFFGNVISSTRPARRWHVARRADGYNELTGIACPSVSSCVATDHYGNVLVSSQPTGGTGAWRVAARTHRSLTGLSCPDPKLCVAVDTAGEVIVATRSRGR